MTQGGNPPPGNLLPELLAPLQALALSGPVRVALSGGLDSMVLLHVAHGLFGHRPEGFSAIHINHQLQSDAATFEVLCRQACEQLAVPLEVVTVQVDTGQGSLEARARQARYRVFEERLAPGEVLLMAHHGDDQAETRLFRFLRGSGVRGLAGMPTERPLGRGRLVRPWLAVPRQCLRDQAQRSGWTWVEDPTNRDERFDRNFLRHSIMPVLRQRWPELDRRLQATASACAESAELAELLAQTHFRQLHSGDERIHLAGLRGLVPAAQRNLLQWWLGPTLDRTLGDGEILELMDAAVDACPEIRGGGFALRRFRDHIYRIAETGQPMAEDQPLSPGSAVRDGVFQVCLHQAGGAGPVPDLRLSHRSGGEVLRPTPGGVTRPLKKWLQEQGVPPWERDRLPLVFRGERELVAVGDLWCAADLTAPDGTCWLEIRRE